VAREGFVVFFSEAFDAMFRLCADSEANVQNAVTFLDNLVKARSDQIWGLGDLLFLNVVYRDPGPRPGAWRRGGEGSVALGPHRRRAVRLHAP
jgi:hypothetical protein